MYLMCVMPFLFSTNPVLVAAAVVAAAFTHFLLFLTNVGDFGS